MANISLAYWMMEYQSYIMRYDGEHQIANWLNEYQSYIMRYDG